MNTYKFHCVEKNGLGYRDTILTVGSEGTFAEVVASVAVDRPNCFFIDYNTKAPFCFRTPVKIKSLAGAVVWSDQEVATIAQVETGLNMIGGPMFEYIEHRETVAVLLTSFAGRSGDFLKLCGVSEKGAKGFHNPSIFNCI